MKKLLFFLPFVFLVLCTQFRMQQPKGNCKIVTDNFKTLLGPKSDCGTIPISYRENEYIVVMPQSKDSIALKKALAINKYKLLKVNTLNSAIQLYRYDGADTNPKPKPAPAPIIDDRIVRNSMLLNQKGYAISLFETFSNPVLNPKMR